MGVTMALGSGGSLELLLARVNMLSLHCTFSSWPERVQMGQVGRSMSRLGWHTHTVSCCGHQGDRQCDQEPRLQLSSTAHSLPPVVFRSGEGWPRTAPGVGRRVRIKG